MSQKPFGELMLYEEFLKKYIPFFCDFHGSVRELADKEPTGGLVRTHLYYFIMDFLSDLFIGRKLQLPNFHDSLKELGTVQMLTVGWEATIEVQASMKIFKVEEKLSRGWGGENAYHVSGYRYLLVDGDRYISWASPPGKVTTLTKVSLVALSKLREEVDSEKSRANWDSGEKDLEVCSRTKGNAWVIARHTRRKELYMVLEKAGETLLSASEAVKKFSERYCDGNFSLD